MHEIRPGAGLLPFPRIFHARFLMQTMSLLNRLLLYRLQSSGLLLMINSWNAH